MSHPMIRLPALLLLSTVLFLTDVGLSDDVGQSGISAFLSGVSSFLKEERRDAAHEITFDPKGFWPKAEQFAAAEKVDTKRADFYQTWLARVLNETVHAKGSKWDRSEWLMIPQPAPKGSVETGGHPADRVYHVAGQVESQNKRASRIEFQTLTNRYEMTLTILSDEAIPNRKVTKAEVLELLHEFLNIPKEQFEHLDVEMTSTVIGDDQSHFSHGKVFDRRHKHPEYDHPELLTQVPPGLPPGKYYKFVPLIPEMKREWYSPMDFWIAKSRLCITFSTIDWKDPNRPM